MSTLKRRLAAKIKMHALLKLPNPTSDEDVRIALRRAFRKKPSRPRQALRLSHELRDSLISTFDETLYGKRNKALISVGYDILARRSELVSIHVEDLQDRETILIRRSKNDPFGEGRLAVLSAQSIEYLFAWLSAANIKTGPIFRSIKGAAQDMMLNGCDILPIIAAGGWKSINVVARYVEKADVTKLRFKTFPYQL